MIMMTEVIQEMRLDTVDVKPGMSPLSDRPTSPKTKADEWDEEEAESHEEEESIDEITSEKTSGKETSFEDPGSEAIRPIENDSGKNKLTKFSHRALLQLRQELHQRQQEEQRKKVQQEQDQKEKQQQKSQESLQHDQLQLQQFQRMQQQQEQLLHQQEQLQQIYEAGMATPSELELRAGGIWARTALRAGQRYGPFIGKWASTPMNIKYAWEVLANNGARGWLDGSYEAKNWLKYIRSSNDPQSSNVRDVVEAGQLWYEITRDIPSGAELILPPRHPLQLLQLISEHSTVDDRSDRETGSQHSGGTAEDEREGEEEEDQSQQEILEARCLVCDKQFQDIELLDEHLVNSHRYPPEQYRCDLCSRSYAYRPCLLRHRALAHGDLRKYPCENCPKVFTDPSNLQRHIRTHHVGARSHACPECGKTFATSSGLKQHTHIHSSVKPFQCEVCFKAYTQFSNLCRHKRMHADCRMQIKCGKCGQSFSTVTSLSKHKRFCDSTGSLTLNHQNASPSSAASVGGIANLPLGAGVHQMPHLHQQHNNMHQQFCNPHHSTVAAAAAAAAAVASPFMMYNRPFPFPPNLAAAYQGLFNHHATMGAHTSTPQRTQPGTGFMGTSPMFQQLMTPRSTNDLRMEMANNDNHPNMRVINVTENPAYQSSSTGRDKSPLRPSNVRPNKTSSTATNIGSIYSDPRESLTLNSSGNNDPQTSSDDEEDDLELDQEEHEDSVRNLSRASAATTATSATSVTSVATPASTVGSEVSGEQPLDLSTSRKRKHSECSERSRTPSTPHTTQVTEDKKPKIQVKEEEQLISPPARPSPRMAYPRPLHPMFLDSLLYRRPQPPPPQPPSSGFGNRFANGFQRFPFLGPRFDMLRPQLPPGFGAKPFQDVLSAHVGTHAVAKLKDRYACKFCGKVFPRSANLTRHLRTHTGEQPYKCKYCERSFSISSNLQRHVRNIHNKEKPFKCPLCERCFGQQTNLDRHLKKHEAEEAGGASVAADSPGSSNDNEREDTYFDEIRSFMGKVTYAGANDAFGRLYEQRGATQIVSVDDDIEEIEEIDEEIEDNSEALAKIEKQEPLNNNEAIEVST